MIYRQLQVYHLELRDALFYSLFIGFYPRILEKSLFCVKYLSVISEPDEIIQHYHPDCASCPYRDKCIEKACTKETCHVIDAVVDVNITAHEKMYIAECPKCKSPKSGEFPADITNHVQYGKNLEALAVSLNTVGAVSVNRVHEINGHTL